MPAPDQPGRHDRTPFPNLSTLWGRVLVDELARCGVRRAVIAPGSRSTPLALACADHPDVADVSVIDERSAAFVALGLARATGLPAAVISTSGTAAANFLPAVLEADRSAVPLLVLTADRPARLRDAGDSQTADQIKLYGDRVRWFHQTPEPVLPPGHEEATLRALRSAACHAWDRAFGIGGLGPPPGPVHLNVPFDKPLEPTPAEHGAAGALPEGFDPAGSAGARGRGGGGRWRRTDGGGSGAPGPETIEEVALALRGARRPLILVGAQPGRAGGEDRLRRAVTRLLSVLPVPVWAEAASGLRTGSEGRTGVVATADLLLESDRFRERMGTPDLLLRLGEAPIGWAGRRFVAELATASDMQGIVEQIAVDPWGRRRDPDHAVSRVVAADPAALLAAVTDRLAALPGDPTTDPAWAALHSEADRTARDALPEEADRVDEIFDGGVFHHLGRVAPDDTALVVSSSMPLRELELFLPASTASIDLFANRGLNGIDGVTATALGVALGRRAAGASGTATSRTVLVTGDVAFVHDLSGALAAGRLDGVSDLVVVLVDNGGGAIFDHLPAAGHEPGFTRHLTTPTGADFEGLARGCGLSYEAPRSWKAFREALDRALCSEDPPRHPRLLHIRTEGARSKGIRERIIARVAQAVDRRLAEPLPAEPSSDQRATAERADPLADPPLLLLHGFTGSRRDWDDLRARLPTLPTLAVDLPGHGDAAVPPEGATLDAAISTVLAALDRRGIERAHLAGYSMGGRIALACAARHPERVASLTLVGASPGIAEEPERRERRERDETLARQIEEEGLETFVDRWMALPLFATQARLGHRALRRAREARLAGSARGYAASLRGMGQGAQPSFWEKLSRIEVPTLLVAGEEDAKYTRIAREMADAMPDARVDIVPGTGHAVHLEAPETVARLLAEHLRTGGADVHR